MQKQSILNQDKLSYLIKNGDRKHELRIRCALPSSIYLPPDGGIRKSGALRSIEIVLSLTRNASVGVVRLNRAFRFTEIKCVAKERLEELKEEEEEEEEDDELCPVDCVREFNTDEEFQRILEKAKETGSLVVVDFYRTSCGSCKYIEQIFSKLCKGSGEDEASVVFLKHNVIDEYDEQSEVAERLRIKSVPLFHFYKNGVLQEAFPTRDKERITAAILKYSTTASPPDA